MTGYIDAPYTVPSRGICRPGLILHLSRPASHTISYFASRTRPGARSHHPSSFGVRDLSLLELCVSCSLPVPTHSTTIEKTMRKAYCRARA